jgi:predicted MFS family arabinose efflux permease
MHSLAHALRSESVLALLGAAFCYIYTHTFFQTWFYTFLVKGRGLRRRVVPSALPYVIAACANVAGGAPATPGAAVRSYLGPTLARRRRAGSAGLFTLAAMATSQPLMTIVLLSLIYGGITFQQAGVFGVCLDLGGRHAGAVVGLMNTSAQVGALAGSIAYGYIVERFHSYTRPFVHGRPVVHRSKAAQVDASKESSAGQPADDAQARASNTHLPSARIDHVELISSALAGRVPLIRRYC